MPCANGNRGGRGREKGKPGNELTRRPGRREAGGAAIDRQRGEAQDGGEKWRYPRREHSLMVTRFLLASAAAGVLTLALVVAATSAGCSNRGGVALAQQPSARSPSREASPNAGPLEAARGRVERALAGDLSDPGETRLVLQDVLRSLDALELELARREPRPPSAAREVPAGLEVVQDEHPFAPAVRMATESLERIREIKDYSALFIKRERVGGRLLEYEYMSIKVRHDPLSVYIRFLAPERLKGREVIYVQGKNNNHLLVHEPADQKGIAGIFGRLAGTVRLAPTAPLAMLDNRYPITEIGMLNLTRRLIEVGEQDMQHAEAEARFYPNARVNDRPVLAMQFMHPVRRDHFRFHLARVYIDKELKLPIRFESYDWPAEPGGDPVLLEEYTYTRLQLNPGFTDLDFDPKNPDYQFP
jgi:hypothetical protein